ncbi:ABC transporter substrate-binding protein [Fusobacterium mortiferum]|uniref:ABC transporter substrate-binding protein n=1 Tax=Fusobacterium mortiferum TaxID=850 RepID=A0ABS2G1B0_FUSMR|nr:ABC transporter substrate-binding protein [Fusobacterium mortiferum]MBM6874555.1 ABC transporter substrate-binding protein [Fusobacterium mortiferum]
MKKIIAMLAGATMMMSCGANQSQEESSTIKVGGMGPLTGSAAMYGITVDKGAKLAFEEINANGGVLGKKFEYISLDEKADPIEAVNAYNKLTDERVVAILGSVTSKPTLAVAELAAQDGIPMITPTGTQINITDAGPNIFRVCFTDPYQGSTLAKFSKDELGAKTAAIMVNTSSDYSDGIANAFIKQAEKEGIKVVAKEGYSDGDKDFKAQLTKINSENPDILVVPEYYELSALIATQAREIGMKSTFVGPDGWDGIIGALDSSSYSVVDNSYFTNHYSTEDNNEKVQSFLKKYREKYNEEPTAFSALAYDTVYVLKNAIDKAGTTDKAELTKAIKASDMDGVTGHLTFDENNNPIKAVTIIKVQDGKYIFDSVVETK